VTKRRSLREARALETPKALPFWVRLVTINRWAFTAAPDRAVQV
jgi:hypothetical protein